MYHVFDSVHRIIMIIVSKSFVAPAYLTMYPRRKLSERLLQWWILGPSFVYIIRVYKVLRRIQQSQPGTPGRTPSLFENMRYTTHGNNGFTSHPKDDHGLGFEPTLCWSETPEFELVLLTARPRHFHFHIGYPMAHIFTHMGNMWPRYWPICILEIGAPNKIINPDVI